MASDGFSELKDSCRNYGWINIYRQFGIDVPEDPKKYIDCPICNSKEKFRVDNKNGWGTWVCKCQGADKDNAGFKLIALTKFSGDFKRATREIAKLIGEDYKSNGNGNGRRADEDAVTKKEELIKYWEEAIDPALSNAGGQYLVNIRKCCDEDDLTFGDIRFHPAFPYAEKRGESYVNTTMPALICIHRSPEDESVALAAIFLKEDGTKARLPKGQGKKTHAISQGITVKGAIKLDEPTDVLAITEGVETAIYVRFATGLPVWAAKDAGLLKQVAIPAHVRKVYIFGDNDISGTGQEAAYKLAEDLRELDPTLEIYVLIPGEADKDWLDVRGLSREVVDNWKPYDPIDSWPEPQKISQLDPVMDLHESLVPEAILPYVKDRARQLCVKLDYTTAAFICAASIVIGRGACAKPLLNGDYKVVPNLWGMAVGYVSVKKSPATDPIFEFLDWLEKESRKEFKAAKERYKGLMNTYKFKLAGLGDNLRKATRENKEAEMLKWDGKVKELKEPEPPVRRRFYTNEATHAAMQKLNADNQRGIMLEQDELSGFFRSLEQDNRRSERQMWLGMWNGYGRNQIDRISRDTEPGPPCGSIFGGIQPDVLGKYLQKSLEDVGNDGFFQRFQLMVFPDRVKFDYRDEKPNKEAKDKAYKILHKLAFCNFVTDFGAEEGDVPVFQFSEGANVIYEEWIRRNEIRLEHEQFDSPYMEGHLGKYTKLFVSLALIFHLIECADKGTTGEVTTDAVVLAKHWCEYLESHARRVYGMLAGDTKRGFNVLAHKIRTKHLKTSFTLGELKAKDWSGLTDERVCKEALERLVAAQWLRMSKGRRNLSGRGQIAEIYEINPKVWRQ